MEPERNLDERALLAKGSDEEMNRFVAENTRFIVRCASKVCRRYITKSDDEYEVAMLAFWEAVRKYEPGAGSFSAFAALVIRRRLMDFFDSQTRHAREISAGHAMTWEEEEEGNKGILSEVQRSIVQDADEDKAAIREEIEAIGDILREYGFSFFDLAEASPKAEKTKRCCARAVNWMLAVAERILQMRRSRSLPVAAISAALEIARKILERHRRYIIASTEILDGDFPYLAEYLEYIRKERA